MFSLTIAGSSIIISIKRIYIYELFQSPPGHISFYSKKVKSMYRWMFCTTTAGSPNFLIYRENLCSRTFLMFTCSYQCLYHICETDIQTGLLVIHEKVVLLMDPEQYLHFCLLKKYIRTSKSHAIKNYFQYSCFIFLTI